VPTPKGRVGKNMREGIEIGTKENSAVRLTVNN
jgi:hypothetical protein